MYVMISEIEQLMNIDWKMLVIGILLIVIIFPKVGGAWKEFWDFIGYEPKSLRKECERQEQINELIRKQEEYHQQSIQIRDGLDKNQQLLEKNQEEIRGEITKLLDTFNAYIKSDNERTVAMLRNSLWRNHKEFTEQGYVTPEGLQTFEELGKVYEAAGGNDIFHDKLKPEVEALEIRYQ